MTRVLTRLRVSSDVICWSTGSEKVIFYDGSLFFISVFYKEHLVIYFVYYVDEDLLTEPSSVYPFLVFCWCCLLFLLWSLSWICVCVIWVLMRCFGLYQRCRNFGLFLHLYIRCFMALD